MSNKKVKKRRVLVITGSRGEYGYIRPILKLMKKSKLLEPEVLVTNMHLIPEFGSSANEFLKDNIQFTHKIHMSLAGYTNATMVKSLGIFMMSISDILSNKQYDIILIAGDRGEQLVAAIAGAHMNILVAHIQAGERSGNIDGLTRHAIARFAHIHFVANSDAEKRLLNMGEEPFRIHKVGAPQLDEFIKEKIASPEDIAKKYSLDLKKPIVLVVQHPVTEQANEAGKQMMATMQAIINAGHQALIIYPNNDAGSCAIQECIQRNRSLNIKVERNVSRKTYGGLMQITSVLMGNSSSGIIEAPTFKLPVVNIGRRQEGRLQAKNVINVPRHDSKEIESALRKALSKSFKRSLECIKNPYGDGQASERIVRILEETPADEKILFKKITY